MAPQSQQHVLRGTTVRQRLWWQAHRSPHYGQLHVQEMLQNLERARGGEGDGSDSDGDSDVDPATGLREHVAEYAAVLGYGDVGGDDTDLSDGEEEGWGQGGAGVVEDHYAEDAAGGPPVCTTSRR